MGHTTGDRRDGGLVGPPTRLRSRRRYGEGDKGRQWWTRSRNHSLGRPSVRESCAWSSLPPRSTVVNAGSRGPTPLPDQIGDGRGSHGRDWDRLKSFPGEGPGGDLPHPWKGKVVRTLPWKRKKRVNDHRRVRDTRAVRYDSEVPDRGDTGQSPTQNDRYDVCPGVRKRRDTERSEWGSGLEFPEYEPLELLSRRSRET